MEGLLMGMAVVAVLGGIAVASSWRLLQERVEFEKRFPAVSDAEFLARCTPGTDPQIALRVRKVLSDIYSVDENRIYPSSRLINDLEW